MTASSRSGGSKRTPHRTTGTRGALRQQSKPARPTSGTGKQAERKPSGSARSSSTSRRKRPPPYIPGPARRGRRLAPSYDLEGPRVRLGIAWAFAVVAALAIGRLVFNLPLLCVLFSATAAIAAMQVVDAWEPKRQSSLRLVAAGCAALVGGSAMFGAKALGAALLVAVAVALFAGVSEAAHRRPLLGSTALVLQAALPVGLVAASVQLLTHYEIGAVIVLLATALGFDLGDFLIGSGAGSLIEGPLAGALVIAMVAAVAAIIQAPPFDGIMVWAFAVAAMVLCPLGQVAASWLLPDSTSPAPALRRLDSLLLLAPAWTVAAGILAATA